MSVPEIKNAKQLVEVLRELQAMVEPKNAHRMYDVVTAIVAYAEDRHAHELAEKQRAFMDTALKMSPWATGPDGRPLRIDALIDLIDPQKES